MNCVFYLRVSTSDQSVNAQRIELTNYVKAKGWTVLTEFSDTISGSKRDRPGLDALFNAVRAGGIQAVLCVKLDRVARSLSHFAQVVAEFEKLDVALICTSQGIDTSKSNACGRLQMNVLSAVAEFERELIRERTRAGLAAVKAKGVRLGRHSEKLPPEPERIRIVNLWRQEKRDSGYRHLAEMLGGVNVGTAYRLARNIPVRPVYVPPETIEIE